MNRGNSGLHYELIKNLNSRENLVFVHGSGCNRKFLRPLAKRLTDFNCYLIDLPGHGKSRNGTDMTVEDYIDAVADFVSGLKNVTLIGHSLGGTVCLGVAAKPITSVKRSVIISSGARFDKLDRRFHEMVEKQKVNWLYLLECLGSLHHLSVIMDLFTFEEPKVILKDFEIDIELDLSDVIGDIKTPTLIMVGSSDILTIPEYSYRLKKSIKKSKLVIVPNYKHMLPIAKSKEVSDMIRKFILICQAHSS